MDLNDGFAESAIVKQAANRPTAVRWRILAILLAYSFMSWFNRMTMSVAYNEQIAPQLGIDKETMGGVFSILVLAYAFCMIPGGWLADRYGPWKALIAMGFGSALFQAATGWVGLLLPVSMLVAAWLVIRALMGALSAPIYPSSGRIVSHWFPPQQRALANGLVTGAALIGIASTFFGFGGLMALVGWPLAFVAVGVITASAALLWTIYATDRPSQHPGVNYEELQWIQSEPLMESPLENQRLQASTAGWWHLFKNRSLVLLTISYAAVGYFEYLMYFWAQNYFDDILKLGTARSRTYATLLNLAMAAGIMLGGAISDRLVRSFGYRRGRMLVPVCGMSAGAGLLYLGAGLQEPWIVLLCFSLAVAAVGACEGPFWTIAIDLGGARGSTSAAICNTGGNIGGAIAPRVTPWIGRVYDWPTAIAAGSLVCLAGVCLWWWIDPKEGVTDK
jgi:sugar phosphate permease